MAFRVAISGLKAASGELDVIGNNIANSNTAGFKKSRAEFVDVFAVSSVGGSGSTPGSGVRLSAIRQQFTQGNIAFTDNNLDMAINGSGFFILDDSGTQIYSRGGAFGVDRNGFLANAQGQNLIAFGADASGNITGAAGAIQVNTSNIAPQASANMTVDLNLDAAQGVPAIGVFDATNPNSFNHSTSTTIFDSLGNSHLASMYYVKTATANQWESYTFVDGTQVDGPDTLSFSSTGALTAPASGTLTTPSFTPSGGGAAMTLAQDYSATTQYGSAFSVNALAQDGFTTGRLSGLDIDSEGIIFARFTNGQSSVQGQIALADFPNNQGLQPVSDTSWGETFSSGAVTIGAPGTASLGLLQAGALEQSNTDLSEELVNMIIAQRSFQANAEVISTADTVTQSIINLR
ncbi:MAG: flagellar hook protein FlgE [marine bacterium B5-7]|nr:MAG: flagellar hook protein FlgE [marine bacterium B5-7]